MPEELAGKNLKIGLGRLVMLSMPMFGLIEESDLELLSLTVPKTSKRR